MPRVLAILFALSVMPFVLSAVGVVLRVRTFERFDNHTPRIQQAEMRGLGARVNGAQANSWEALTVFTVVVFIAFASGVPLAALDSLATAFIALRLVYTGLYLADLAWPRSVVFAAAMACCIAIFVRAAMASVA